jgi:replication initiation protein RepC
VPPAPSPPRHDRRKGLDQVLETAAELGFTEPEWRQLGDEARDLARALRKVESPDEMAVGVASLERRHKEARERLESAISQAEESSSKGVNSDPLGSENRPHQYNYKSNLNSKKNTVIAHKECKSGVELPSYLAPIVPAETAKARQEQQTAKPARMDAGPVLRLTTDELVCLAPRLRPYLRTASPTWPEIVDAADWLRNDLGVSKSLWGDACLAMGREQAAIAVAIVSAKPPEHFTTTPGGYFNGMVARAKAGTLNLSRTIWGLRSNQQAGKERTRRMN